MHEMDSTTLIIDIVIIISASFFFGIFAHKLKQSVIIAYIIAGVLVGPYGLGLINKVGEVNSLAEIGVALLMFAIGIEFKISNIGHIWKVIIFGGLFQISFMICCGFGLSRIFGCSLFDSVLLGMIGSISSTMIVVKILTEKRELERLSSRIMIGLLIVQDLAVVIMVFFIINFDKIATGNVFEFFKILGISAFSVVAIIFIGRKLLPKFMYIIVKMQSKEMFLLSIFSFAIGISLTTHLLGLSFALGAFIVGFMLSEAEYNLEISAQIRPLKDIFIVIFFVSVGLFINPRVIFDHIYIVLLIVPFIMAAKFLACAIPTWLFGFDSKTAFKVGAGMIQIGEFSFVMLAMARKHDFLSDSIFSTTIASALISIILTPVAISNSDKIHYFMTKILKLSVIFKHVPRFHSITEGKEKNELKNHIIICGFGRCGSSIANGLKNDFDIVVIENNINKISQIKKAGYKYFFGDAMNHHLLIKGKVSTAKILILSFPDINTKKIATRYAKVYNPEITVIVRAKTEEEKEELLQVGADSVIIPQVLEAVEIIGKIITPKLSDLR